MEIKDFFTRWTTTYSIIGFFAAIFMVNILKDAFFEGIVYIMIFHCILMGYSFIHSFFYFGFKNKLIGTSIDMLPLIWYFIFSIFMGWDHFEDLFIVSLFYLIPILLIATISTSLQHLYKKLFKK